MKITIKEIPYFLTLGKFYPTLEDEEIEIDDENIVFTLSVETENEFFHLLRISSFWQLYRLPVEIYVYFLFNRHRILTLLEERKEIPHIREYYHDFFLSIGLLKYKHEILDFISFKKEMLNKEMSMLNKEMSMLNKEISNKEMSMLNKEMLNKEISNKEMSNKEIIASILESTPYYSLKISIEEKTKDGIIVIDRKYTKFSFTLNTLFINILNDTSSLDIRIYIPDKICNLVEQYGEKSTLNERLDKVLNSNMYNVLEPLYSGIKRIDPLLQFKYQNIIINELNKNLILNMLKKCENEYKKIFSCSIVENIRSTAVIGNEEYISSYIEKERLTRDDSLKITFCKLIPSFL